MSCNPFRRALRFSALLAIAASGGLAGSHLFAAGNTTPATNDVFADAGSVASFPFLWREGVVVLPVSIKGSRPLNFVLDTGSSRMLIDRKLAATLGLKAGEVSSLQGAGAGRIRIEALHNVDLRLPGLQSKAYDCFTADLSPLEETLKLRVDGIIGYDFFAHYVVTIDFAAKKITVALPSAFHPIAGAEEIPLELRGKWAFVKGELVLPGQVTVQDRFFIDSGSSDAVDHPIVKTMQTRIASRSGVGLGTPVEGATARAESFRIGSFTLPGLVISCCGATDETSRLIGTEVLRRFTVVFDYPHSRLFLSPNDALHEEFSASPSSPN